MIFSPWEIPAHYPGIALLNQPKVTCLFFRFFQGNCDFDSHLCLWSHSYKFSFNWTLRRYSTSSLNTGPSRDHTSGNLALKSHFAITLHFVITLYLLF